MRNVSDKFVEKFNKHFIFSNFSRKSRFLLDNVEKHYTAGQIAKNNTPHAHCMLDN